jgi:hypothetical protein
MTILILACCLHVSAASTDIVGDWSESVADNRGYSLRGRLVLVAKLGRNGQSETVLYVELQDTCTFIGNGMRVFCEMGKTDFRPEYKGGLNCELVDKSGKPFKLSSFPFGGAVPKSEWVYLPVDSSIRVRATPFGLRRDNARVICPHLGAMWVIENSDKSEYTLKATFTVLPHDGKQEVETVHSWTGTLKLPSIPIKPVRQ